MNVVICMYMIYDNKTNILNICIKSVLRKTFTSQNVIYKASPGSNRPSWEYGGGEK